MVTTHRLRAGRFPSDFAMSVRRFHYFRDRCSREGSRPSQVGPSAPNPSCFRVARNPAGGRVVGTSTRRLLVQVVLRRGRRYDLRTRSHGPTAYQTTCVSQFALWRALVALPAGGFLMADAVIYSA